MSRTRWASRSRSILPLALLACLASAQEEPLAPVDLPVTRVVLSTAGVGYFEHAGIVAGTQELELRVAPEHMDDLLQSLVLQDLDGGDVRPVRYGARDPLARILGSYALDLSGDPSLSDLLRQARGEALTLETDERVVGVLVNVERVATGADTQTTLLTLATESGLRRIDLDDVRDLRFERASLRAELDAALAAIATSRDADLNVVRLRFEGEGERRVRIGYVREMPVWKPSYRLVLHDDGTADLQGWAIFDNPTNLDLVDVEVAFVAGRPISFVSELFAPVYVDRPRVGPTVAESFVPPVDAGLFAPSASRFAPAAPSPMADSFMEAAPQLGGAGVSAMAEGVDTGTSFAYVVRDPVSVARFESAMIPVVLGEVGASQVSFFDGRGPGGAPLHAVRLVNDTGVHLAAGPVTLFDAGGFAGAALLGDVPPDEERLLTYAVDLDVQVTTTSSGEPEQLVAVALRGGLLETEYRLRLVTTVRVSGGAEGRFVIVELPRRDGFEVVAPTPGPAETADALRFGIAWPGDPAVEDDARSDDDAVPTHLTCPPDEACRLDVVFERTEARTVALASVPIDRLGVFLANPTLDEEDRAVLRQVVELQTQAVTLDRRAADRRARLDAVFRDQDRVRQNMGALDRNGTLYRRYLADLEAQEDEVDQIEAELAALAEERRSLQESFDTLVAGLADQAVD